MKSLRFNKICDANDWNNEQFQSSALECVNHARKHRKLWEVSQTFRTIRSLIPPASYGLGLACGSEALIYKFSQDYKVIATDLYGLDSKWVTARKELKDVYTPKDQFKGIKYPYCNLVAMRMDMRDVANCFAENTFDFAWSLCSIEHLDSIEEIYKTINDVGNVLKPTGIFAFTTEWFIQPPLNRHPGSIAFYHDTLKDIEDMGFNFVEEDGYISTNELSLFIKAETETRLDYIDNRIRDIPFPKTEDPLPHISLCLRDGRFLTSSSFCIRKK